VRLAGIAPAVTEGQGAWRAFQGPDEPRSMGGVGVSGVLAEQLARELGEGAEPGAVRVLDAPVGVAVALRVIAGEPDDDDESFVAAADRGGTPVVIVQLWPQADWTPPFVLSPFVVECRAGEGFPIREIAARIGEAVEHAPFLASRIPALHDVVESRSVQEAVARAALLALRGRTRRLITLEQLRLAARLRSLESGAAVREPTPALVATAAALVGSGFAFRAAARTAARVLPAPIANAAVAAAGTWVLAEALRRLDARAGR